MEINVVSGELAAQQADTIVVAVAEETRRLGGAAAALDGALDGSITALLRSGIGPGRANQATPIATGGRIPAARVVVQGLGKRAQLTPERLRNQTAGLARTLRGLDAGSVAISTQGAQLASRDAAETGRILAEAFELGLYRFDQHRTRAQDKPSGSVSALTIVETSARRARAAAPGAERGAILAEAQNFARDLANSPANLMTPSDVAERAQTRADELGLECEVIERAAAERMGMNSYL